jgi:NAD(P)-dependent dehydrogenase (short-subunit alcohol dehydrogenase family)
MATLRGRVAIVTGSGQGIGRGEAIALAKEGAAVTVLARSMDRVEAVCAEIAAIGGTALAAQCDVTRREEVDAAVARTVERFGRVDILLNNAQWIPPPHPIETWTESEMRAVWESGFIGTFNFMQACFPHMKAQGGGRIINTVSTVGYSCTPRLFSGYGATKEAIRSFSRHAATEWAVHNITVNCISPAVASPYMLEQFPDDASRQALMDGAGMVIRRFGDAEADVGRVVVFLAGPDTGMMTGCTLSVDGGAHML